VKYLLISLATAASYVPGDEKARALGKGAHGFIAKPFSSKELIAEIERVLR